ncbi:MAG: hypothetical protein ACLQOO_33775 [Terriglobia bacterium]
MSLIQKETTPAMIEANRANAPKSNGPVTEAGKQNSSQNAGKHWGYAQIFRTYLPQLGEHPQTWEEIRRDLFKGIKPEDGFEEGLVEDMAELRLKRQRVVRGEYGKLAQRRRDMEIEREQRVYGQWKGMKGTAFQMLMKSTGLAGLPDGDYKFTYLLCLLLEVRAQLELEGFNESGETCLLAVYGPHAGLTGSDLIRDYKAGLKATDQEDRERRRRSFVAEISREIESYQHLESLYHETKLELSEAQLDAALLPSKEDAKNFLRLERAIEFEFQLKLQQLYDWRREKRQADSIDVTPSDSGDNGDGRGPGNQPGKRKRGRPRW